MGIKGNPNGHGAWEINGDSDLRYMEAGKRCKCMGSWYLKTTKTNDSPRNNDVQCLCLWMLGFKKMSRHTQCQRLLHKSTQNLKTQFMTFANLSLLSTCSHKDNILDVVRLLELRHSGDWISNTPSSRLLVHKTSGKFRGRKCFDFGNVNSMGIGPKGVPGTNL